MARRFIVTPEYYQGPGVLQQLGEKARAFGARAAVLISPGGMKRIGDMLTGSCTDAGVEVEYIMFNGETTTAEIERAASAARNHASQVLIGVGGGKVLDTAKAAALTAGLPMICCPTIAASDAPCSSLTVAYTPDGAVEQFISINKNPDLVLVDSSVIMESPIRLTVAGMGDALSTYFEARASYRKDPSKITRAGIAAARLCYDILMENGLQARSDIEADQLTDAVEAIIEANTLLSCIGFENGGRLSAAHSLHNSLSLLPETHQYYHGEKVAFGTLFQLVLESAPEEEIRQVLEFCLNVGLPVTCAQLGITDLTPEKLQFIAEATCTENGYVRSLPFKADAAMVADAIVKADRIGQEARNR